LYCRNGAASDRTNTGAKPVPSWSLIQVAIEPKSTSDADRLDAALSRLVAIDARLGFKRCMQSGQFLLGGMNEDHLDFAVTRLRDDDGPPVTIGAPQVAYREKIGRAIRIDYTHKRVEGPTGEFARVVINFAPAAGFSFENKAGAAILREFAPSIERGIEIERRNGVCAGFPLIDFSATLIDGASHDSDSSEQAFQLAAQGAVRKLNETGVVQLAEPVMTIEVSTPEEFLDQIESDLKARRGEIRDRRTHGGTATLKALAPLANMFGYTNNLRAISEGCATYSMEFREYRVIPL
jgi:elongation factor G